MKFPFGGPYEYAKNNKTVISFLVRFFFSSTATQVLSIYAFNLHVYHGMMRNFELNFREIFQSFRKRRVLYKRNIFRMMLTNASLNSRILAE